jgi:hypothetical protein
LPIGAFIALLVFLLLLIEGLVWAWSKGCLSWGNEQSVPAPKHLGVKPVTG